MLIDDDYFCDFLVSLYKIDSGFLDILYFLSKDIVYLHSGHGPRLKSSGYGRENGVVCNSICFCFRSRHWHVDSRQLALNARPLIVVALCTIEISALWHVCKLLKRIRSGWTEDN